MPFSWERPIPRRPDAEGNGPADSGVESSKSEYVQFLRENGLKSLESLDLSIFFGRHLSASDADDVMTHAKGVDVFIPEVPGQRRKDDEMFNRISMGKDKPHEVSDAINPFAMRLLHRLANSGIRVAVADVPKGSRVSEFVTQANKRWSAVPNEIAKRRLERKVAKELFVQRAKAFGEAMTMRERYIANQICPAILRALESDKSNAARTSLKVLIFMGAGHLELATLVKQKHQSTKVIEGISRQYVYSDELLNALEANEAISDALVDNAFTEDVIRSVLGTQKMEHEFSHEELTKALRDMTDAVDMVAREKLHSLMMENKAHQAREFLQQHLSRKFGVLPPIT